MTIEIAPIAPEAKRPIPTEAGKAADKSDPSQKCDRDSDKAFAKTLADADAQADSDPGKDLGRSNQTDLPTTKEPAMAGSDQVVDSNAQTTALLAQMGQVSQSVSPDLASPEGAAPKDVASPGKGAAIFTSTISAVGQNPAGVAGPGVADGVQLANVKRSESARKSSNVDDAQTAQTAIAQKPEDRLAKFFAAFAMDRVVHESAEAHPTVNATSLGAEKQPGERSLFKSVVSEAANTAATQDLSSFQATYEVVQAEPITPTDTYIAEKVAYWMSNDVQNAEMTLDGTGGEKVEVSIRMQGNEAQVAFRSDELKTREALQHASSHLKDMLLREGVVLSGVSVGTAGAGQDGAGGQQGKERSSVKKMSFTAVQPAAAPVGRRLGSPAGGRAVDLFV
jgi:flagellar hook-length control protein FliK